MTASDRIQPVLPFGRCARCTLSHSPCTSLTRNVSGAPDGCGCESVVVTEPSGASWIAMAAVTAVADVPTDSGAWGVGTSTVAEGVGFCAAGAGGSAGAQAESMTSRPTAASTVEGN